MKKVFIDGSEGTTGLRIHQRLESRDDIELLKIDSEKRKDPEEIKKFIAESDITFLCLPDAAAREAVTLAEGTDTVILDTSTAHRTEPGWAYGFPELSTEHRKAVAGSRRIAVPGCHASGFIALVYPLIAGNILPRTYPLSAFSLTGYSGGGKKMIAQYEAEERDGELDSPREYALSQQHKHLKEMQAVCRLRRAPLFSPIVADYYSGMVVSVPLYGDMLNEQWSLEEAQAYFANYYAGEELIRVMPFGSEEEHASFMAGNQMQGSDAMRIYATGNRERLLLTAVFDNLGKGASGAAVQCMNIVLGAEETKGLDVRR
ncbi:MAG: N-acetyl-gamma-glutamyl-phosphate reductase [Lachnospiraceae bacterium]|nr:N-acetyl-gamma-glutamyl-phosphate reductase [Lachnospiraceae bacterium]